MSICGIDAIVISFISYTNCPMPDLEATDKPCCPQRSPPKKIETGMSATPAGTHHFWGNPSVSCVQSWVSVGAINIHRGAQNPWELRCKIVCGEMFQAVHHYTSVQAEPWKIQRRFLGVLQSAIWIHLDCY